MDRRRRRWRGGRGARWRDIRRVDFVPLFLGYDLQMAVVLMIRDDQEGGRRQLAFSRRS